MAVCGSHSHIGITVLRIRSVAEAGNQVCRRKAGDIGKFLAFRFEHSQFFGFKARLRQRAVVHQQQEIVICNMPATQEGFSAALFLQVAVVAVEVFPAIGDAYHTCR